MQKKIRFYLTLNGTSNWSHMFPFHFKMLKVLNAISQRSIFCLLLLTELIILECRPKFDVMTVQSIPIHLSSMIWILEFFYMITRLSTLTDWVTVWLMAIDKIILINTFQWYRRKIRLLSLPRCNTSQTTILIQILLNIGRKFGGSFKTFDGHKTLKDALTCVGLCV